MPRSRHGRLHLQTGEQVQSPGRGRPLAQRQSHRRRAELNPGTGGPSRASPGFEAAVAAHFGHPISRRFRSIGDDPPERSFGQSSVSQSGGEENMRSFVITAAIAAAMFGPIATGAVTASAGTPGVIDERASDCDISLALGVRVEGCSRGLAIGTPTVSPPPEQPLTAAFKINFEFGSSRLTADATALLDKIAKVLTAPAAAGLHFRVAGHTDSVGNANRNQVLSQRRAEAVVGYLSSVHQMDPQSLQAIGLGADSPLNRENPAAAENRRVEITNLGR
ncbi:MAG: OmpA family protein [Azospirillum sp.]|nr:OmpA family protein [Azospirillum sp.]